MSNVFNLDGIFEELENEFKPVVIRKGEEEFVLRNLLRMGRKDRKTALTKLESLQELQNEDEDGDVSQSAEDLDRIQDALAEVIVLVTADHRGNRLVELVGDDLQALGKLVEYWQAATQAGEASDSPC